MDLALCRPSGTLNFEVAPVFFENLCIPVLQNSLLLIRAVYLQNPI